MAYKCRFCQSKLNKVIIDLGDQPPSNDYIPDRKDCGKESFYPLKVFICEECWLVQLPEHTEPKNLFNEDYAYFSSTSSSWLKHAKDYSISTIQKQKLNEDSFVVEIASNDGYLLKNFTQRNIPCLGIEPTKATAEKSIEIGIPTLMDFFGLKLAKEIKDKFKEADLILGNNVLAHVPDINDFISGAKYLLKSDGVISFEFPHVYNLIEQNQFDTIYHEHYSYLSLAFISRLCKKHSLKVFKVDKLKTHGGSLRVWICYENYKIDRDISVIDILKEEELINLDSLSPYHKFQRRAEHSKIDFIRFLEKVKIDKSKVCAYGAAAKGNTFMNFAKIKNDSIPFVVDKSTSKQGKYMPGSHIPIRDIEFLKEFNPDHIIVLPWNLIDEISSELYKEGIKSDLHTFIPEHKIIKF